MCWWSGRDPRWCCVGCCVGKWQQPCFEIGEAPILEAEVGTGGLEPFLKDPVVLGELVDPLLEDAVLGSELLGGLARAVLFEVAELAHQRPDPRPLGADLGVCGLERVLSVQRGRPHSDTTQNHGNTA